jgi:MinD superfamily P-loop ATPase
VHARLEIAEENSGKLVARVRQAAREIAERERLDYIIIDGPPGIGCPVIASLSGSDVALVVAEPTLSGIHDMERILDVARHFAIPAKVVINKYDINIKNSRAIEKFCRERKISVLGRVPFSEEAVESVKKGIPLTEFRSDGAAGIISDIWDSITACPGPDGP